MTIVGVGNPLRGDDAVGLAVTQRLRQRRPDLRVLDDGIDPLTLFERAADPDGVIIVDAVESAAVPGTIHRWEAHANPLPRMWCRASTHALGLADAIELARAMGQLPSTVVLFGIEGGRYEAGSRLSPRAAASVEAAVDAVIQEVESQARQGR